MPRATKTCSDGVSRSSHRADHRRQRFSEDRRGVPVRGSSHSLTTRACRAARPRRNGLGIDILSGFGIDDREEPLGPRLKSGLGHNRSWRTSSRMSDVGVPPQPIDATHALNLSAGVSNFNVLRGRSLSRREISPRPAGSLN